MRPERAPIVMPHTERFRDYAPLILAVARQELTPRQRQVIRLLYLQGLTVSQCAVRLSVNPSTVCRTRDRALARLRRFARYGEKMKNDT